MGLSGPQGVTADPRRGEPGRVRHQSVAACDRSHVEDPPERPPGRRNWRFPSSPRGARTRWARARGRTPQRPASSRVRQHGTHAAIAHQPSAQYCTAALYCSTCVTLRVDKYGTDLFISLPIVGNPFCQAMHRPAAGSRALLMRPSHSSRVGLQRPTARRHLDACAFPPASARSHPSLLSFLFRS